MAKKEQLVKLNEKIEVIGTGKYAMKLNKKYMVHPLTAKTLIAKGAARAAKAGGKDAE